MTSLFDGTVTRRSPVSAGWLLRANSSEMVGVAFSLKLGVPSACLRGVRSSLVERGRWGLEGACPQGVTSGTGSRPDTDRPGVRTAFPFRRLSRDSSGPGMSHRGLSRRKWVSGVRGALLTQVRHGKQGRGHRRPDSWAVSGKSPGAWGPPAFSCCRCAQPPPAGPSLSGAPRGPGVAALSAAKLRSYPTRRTCPRSTEAPAVFGTSAR